ncbi:type IV pilus biogenesis/stability protein PilW [Pseudoteredinibacter isoporae]|uniref:Type IV pilus assembly protein PilF n=1 Tax=Pseudoteredinibacter isoporae TaxID=570281 RepID=A0A7X0JVV4_9GAMM|nr:type IV pilus biogenesis/stability protein PilW [Pseudoteredinibacter isoporae]MBB6523147.1 type IV pilus assembly protein PilF [Pseudoteredinibacter isoporae]NHO88666.1 type IV pilus biogenesis/stability protein PilW [Pseudoteredinibacter isoporae]NIB22643.1 type IV pilus biogenesis/stability protein PilW [Pseudoteredinibacter isoporae]
MTRSLVKTMITSWLLLSLTACVTTYDRVQKKPDMQKAMKTHIRLGLEYLRQNNLDSSRFHFNKALKIDPNSAGAYSGMAALMLREGDDENAERFYERAIRLDSSLSLARNNYGSFLYGKKRYREALNQFQFAANDLNYDRRPLAFNNVGLTQLALGNIDAAEKAFARSITLNPNMARPYIELASIAKSKSEYRAAIQLLDQYHMVSPFSPRSVQLELELAKVLGDKNRESSAEMKLKNMFPQGNQFQRNNSGAQR